MLSKILKECTKYSIVIGYAVCIALSSEYLRSLLFLPVFMCIMVGYEWCIENWFISTK